MAEMTEVKGYVYFELFKHMIFWPGKNLTGKMLGEKTKQGKGEKGLYKGKDEGS